MLKTLKVNNFTVFDNVEFEFSPGLNVIVGENGAGKTHVLKLGYLFSRAWPDLTSERLAVNNDRVESYLEKRLADLFQVNDLSALLKFRSKGGASIEAHMSWLVSSTKIPMPWKVEIQQRGHKTKLSVLEFTLDVMYARERGASFPHQVLVPSKEIVSLFNGFIGIYDKYKNFPLDVSYRDLVAAMSTLELRDSPSLMSNAVQRMQGLLDGELKLEKGELVFERRDGSLMGIPLMAEGYRKLAMLIYLLRYGVIERGATLFWDEPESNLNPAALKLLAEALYTLANSDVQVVVATHSLFLLREFEILQTRSLHDRSSALPCRYFGLGRQENNGSVTVSQGADVADINPLVLLDENLLQSDRYMAAESLHDRD